MFEKEAEEFERRKHYCYEEHTDLWNELCEKAEQFISEVVK